MVGGGQGDRARRGDEPAQARRKTGEGPAEACGSGKRRRTGRAAEGGGGWVERRSERKEGKMARQGCQHKLFGSGRRTRLPVPSTCRPPSSTAAEEAGTHPAMTKSNVWPATSAAVVVSVLLPRSASDVEARQEGGAQADEQRVRVLSLAGRVVTCHSGGLEMAREKMGGGGRTGRVGVVGRADDGRRRCEEGKGGEGGHGACGWWVGGGARGGGAAGGGLG